MGWENSNGDWQRFISARSIGAEEQKRQDLIEGSNQLHHVKPTGTLKKTRKDTSKKHHTKNGGTTQKVNTKSIGVTASGKRAVGGQD